MQMKNSGTNSHLQQRNLSPSTKYFRLHLGYSYSSFLLNNAAVSGNIFKYIYKKGLYQFSHMRNLMIFQGYGAKVK